jgi:alpha-tubulin suppressor-like RCC1 family protein
VDVIGCSCGNAHTAVLGSCGSVFTFGSNEQHQLGHSANHTMVPVPVPVELSEEISSVSSGGAFTLALSASGQLWGVAHSRTSNVSVLRI